MSPENVSVFYHCNLLGRTETVQENQKIFICAVVAGSVKEGAGEVGCVLDAGGRGLLVVA